MIINVPTADDLQTISLRLYFKAWAEVIEIITDWYESSGLLKLGKWIPEEDQFEGDVEVDEDKAWQAYLDAAQSDFQGIYTMMQQSQEIGLKALICEVSPFLLLKRHEAKAVDAETHTYDFTDFQTIDAADLIRAHNTFCNRGISPEFQRQFEEIRKSRNKIHHLGIHRNPIDPGFIIDSLLNQYGELYPGRRWLGDRRHFATVNRWSTVGLDSGGWSELTQVFDELWNILPTLPEIHFRTIMRHGPEEQRYICHACVAEANLGEREPYPTDIPTSYLTEDGTHVHCMVCDQQYKIRREVCPTNDPECGCEYVSDCPDSDGCCMRCGWDKESFERHVKQQAEQKQRLSPFMPVPPSSATDPEKPT
jgi:hypothetical protein